MKCFIPAAELLSLPKEEHVAERWIGLIFGDSPQPRAFELQTTSGVSD